MLSGKQGLSKISKYQTTYISTRHSKWEHQQLNQTDNGIFAKALHSVERVR
jgi:hypothetical protein